MSEKFSSKGSTKHAPRENKQKNGNLPGIPLTWISEKHRIIWVVSPHRTDKRTGCV